MNDLQHHKAEQCKTHNVGKAIIEELLDATGLFFVPRFSKTNLIFQCGNLIFKIASFALRELGIVKFLL